MTVFLFHDSAHNIENLVLVQQSATLNLISSFTMKNERKNDPYRWRNIQF